MIVSIHQPNFLPWYGLIRKIFKSDIFIIFDDVQFPIGKSHYGHRTRIRINTPEGYTYLTIPTHNRSAGLMWNDIQINNDVDWQKRHFALLYNYYHNAPQYTHIREIVKEMYAYDTESLCKFNTNIIVELLKVLKYTGKIVNASDIGVSTTINTSNRIIDLVTAVGGNVYLTGSGAGSQRYIESGAFDRVGIELKYNDFEHPIYNQQFKPFLENLSIIDMLYNVKIEIIIEYLNNG